eukprot:5366238-Pyramimonas_sp.AAC.1
MHVLGSQGWVSCGGCLVDWPSQYSWPGLGSGQEGPFAAYLPFLMGGAGKQVEQNDRQNESKTRNYV